LEGRAFLKRKFLILASRKCLFKPSKYPFLEIIYPTKGFFGIQSPENVYISHQKFPFLEILISKKRDINIQKRKFYHLKKGNIDL